MIPKLNQEGFHAVVNPVYLPLGIAGQNIPFPGREVIDQGQVPSRRGQMDQPASFGLEFLEPRLCADIHSRHRRIRMNGDDAPPVDGKNETELPHLDIRHGHTGVDFCFCDAGRDRLQSISMEHLIMPGGHLDRFGKACVQPGFGQFREGRMRKIINNAYG